MSTSFIMPDIPVEAVQLMIDKAPSQVYREMLTNRGISRLELFTFGMVTTPIIRNEDGERVAYVSVWPQGDMGMVSICEGQGDWFDLVGIEDAAAFPEMWQRGLWPDEAVRLFMKYHAATDDAAAKEQGE